MLAILVYMRQTPVVVAIGLLILAIGSFAVVYDDLFVGPQDTVAVREIAQGSRATQTERKNYLITSAADYALLWRILEAPGDAPQIDFEKESVIAVFAGRQSTAGHDIRVERIEDGVVRKVYLTLTKPNENCLTAQMLTEPYQVVVVPKTILTYAHEDRVVTQSCL